MHERILLITENYPPRTGGSSRWFYEIYSRLSGSQVMVLTDGERDASGTNDEPESIGECRVHWGINGWGITNASLRYAILIARTVSIARHMKANAIHCGRCLPEGFIGRIASKILGIPLLIFCHGEEMRIARASRELAPMARWVFNGCDRIVANSRNTIEMLGAEWDIGVERVELLYPGVDVRRFAPVADRYTTRAALGWSGRTALLTVGRLNQRRKGHDHVIKALPEISKLHPDVLFSIVGDGDGERHLRDLVDDLGVAGAVEFRGATDELELAQCYQGCDLFVLANREVDGDFEGFGMVLVEAQASGRPVLAGTSGGTRETMEPGVTGELVDASNVDSLADTICRMLQDPAALDEMGRAGRDRVARRFDWDILAKQARPILLSLP
jgi:phosphatidyl-myo-inositol dimannoside synthase